MRSLAFWKRKPKTALERMFSAPKPEPFKATPRWRCACECHDERDRNWPKNAIRLCCPDCGH